MSFATLSVDISAAEETFFCTWFNILKCKKYKMNKRCKTFSCQSQSFRWNYGFKKKQLEITKMKVALLIV